MSAADWAAVASAAIALVAMVGSGVGWLFARREKDAAAEHERRALAAAEGAAQAEGRSAAAAERSAAAAEAQLERASEQEAAEESDPWILVPIPGDDDVYLVNRTQSPKYHVAVSGFKVHNPPVQWAMIGPGKQKELSILRIMHPDDDVVITWHQRKDGTDPKRTASETIPSTV